MQAPRVVRGGLVSSGPGKESSNSRQEINVFREKIGAYETKIREHETKIEERVIRDAFHTMIGTEMVSFEATSIFRAIGSTINVTRQCPCRQLLLIDTTGLTASPLSY